MRGARCSRCRKCTSGTWRRGRRHRSRRRRSMSSRRCQCRHARGLGWRLAAGPGRSRRCRCQTGHSGIRRPGCQYQRRAPAEGAAFSARAGSNVGSSPRSRCSTRSRERRRRRNRPKGPLRRTRKRPYRVTAGEANRRRGRADGSPGPKAPEHH